MQLNEAFYLFSALSWCIFSCIKFMTWSYVNSSVLWFLFIEFIISKSSTHVRSDCSHFNTALLKLLNRVERKLHHIQSLNDLLCHFHLSFLNNLFIKSRLIWCTIASFSHWEHYQIFSYWYVDVCLDRWKSSTFALIWNWFLYHEFFIGLVEVIFFFSGLSEGVFWMLL